MSNLMSKIYIGYVVEVIKKNNKPTLELRVRVPSIHGVSSSSGVADKDLPIAKPLLTPGLTINSLKFTEFINNLNKVYVIFESGNFNNPVYLGIKGNSDIYDIPVDDDDARDKLSQLLLKIEKAGEEIEELESRLSDMGIRLYPPSREEPTDIKDGDLWFKIID